MEINQLKYFTTAAKLEHMTNAAKELHIAQPALSQSIRRLEEELNVPLFIPKGRNVILSSYGHYLYNRLVPILDQLDNLQSDLSEMISQEHQTIHINLLAASMLITEAIVAYKRKNPEINFQISQNEDVSADFTIRSTSNQSSLNFFDDYTYSFEEKIFLAVPSTSPLAKHSTINLKEVSNQWFACLTGKQLRTTTDEFCKQAGFHPNIAFQSDNPSSVRNFIEAGLGIGFWPQYTWGPCASNQVKLLPISSPKCSRLLLITQHSHKADHTPVLLFDQFLKTYFHKLTYL